MPRNAIIPYRTDLRDRARALRTHSTLWEVKLWKQIKNRALGVEFHRQVPIDTYIVDFYCHELKLAIEVDGSSHDGKFLYDAHRQTKLESLGVTFIRFSNGDVKYCLGDVIRMLEEKISERMDTG